MSLNAETNSFRIATSSPSLGSAALIIFIRLSSPIIVLFSCHEEGPNCGGGKVEEGAERPG
jgi:hypothetical protein